MSIDPADLLFVAFTSHGIHAIRQEEEVDVPNHQLRASCAVFNRREQANLTILQLDIRIRSKKFRDRLLIESFAGYGNDEEEAVKDAFHKFTQASLHVLLAALIDVERGEDQVEWESWTSHGREWRACLGPLLVQDLEEDEDLRFGELLDTLQALLPESLSTAPHWLRVFYWRKDEVCLTSEALLDNEPWPEGESVINRWNWPSGRYRIRNFLMLLPDGTGTDSRRD
ncbi:MAG TPA: DUF6348 family protein [Terracidiphilus sp.]|nr:DUF6348 family protein [Terracidiphilus sp.]